VGKTNRYVTFSISHPCRYHFYLGKKRRLFKTLWNRRFIFAGLVTSACMHSSSQNTQYISSTATAPALWAFPNSTQGRLSSDTSLSFFSRGSRTLFDHTEEHASKFDGFLPLELFARSIGGTKTKLVSVQIKGHVRSI
jgi:hypothetical protein